MDLFNKLTFTLTGGSTTYGSAIYTNGYPITAIQSPASLTSTALQVQVSLDGTTYQNMIYNGVAYTIPVAAGKTSKIDTTDFVGFPYVKFAPNADESTNVRSFTMIITYI